MVEDRLISRPIWTNDFVWSSELIPCPVPRAVISMQRAHFYKSMTSYGDHRVWQDVYHVPSEAGTLYVKFTADVVTEFLLLSFKEKDDD